MIDRFRLNLIILVICCLFMASCAGADLKCRGCCNDVYGADWLIVQYNQSGGIISHWTLKKKAIFNEENSDGIYFTDDYGNVVHLSGHYLYIEADNDEQLNSLTEKYVISKMNKNTSEESE